MRILIAGAHVGCGDRGPRVDDDVQVDPGLRAGEPGPHLGGTKEMAQPCLVYLHASLWLRGVSD